MDAGSHCVPPSRPNVPSKALLKLNPQVLWHTVDSEIVLLHMETEQMYQLNGTASRLWELVAAGLSERNIVSQLALEYDISENQLDQDVKQMLQSLKDASLIVEAT